MSTGQTKTHSHTFSQCESEESYTDKKNLLKSKINFLIKYVREEIRSLKGGGGKRVVMES